MPPETYRQRRPVSGELRTRFRLPVTYGQEFDTGENLFVSRRGRQRAWYICPNNAVFLSSKRAATTRLCLVVGGWPFAALKRTKNALLVVMNEFLCFSWFLFPSPPQPNLALPVTTTIPSPPLGVESSPLSGPWLLATEAVSSRSLALGYPGNWISICRSLLP